MRKTEGFNNAGIFFNLKYDFSPYLSNTEVILHLNLTIMVSDPKTLLEGTDSWCRPTIRSENVYMCSGEWLQVTYFAI